MGVDEALEQFCARGSKQPKKKHKYQRLNCTIYNEPILFFSCLDCAAALCYKSCASYRSRTRVGKAIELVRVSKISRSDSRRSCELTRARFSDRAFFHPPFLVLTMSLGNEARRGCANFISDNTAGCMPEVWEALSDATVGTAAAYGNDAWTKRLNAAFTEVGATMQARIRARRPTMLQTEWP
jgi:hypothetical protein